MSAALQVAERLGRQRVSKGHGSVDHRLQPVARSAAPQKSFIYVIPRGFSPEESRFSSIDATFSAASLAAEG
jgi:hypothetical protein